MRSHGAQSDRIVQPLAQKHARRLLRERGGIRASDLSPVGRGLLRNWARAAAALELLDRHAAEVGLLDEDGQPHGYTGLYVKLLNSERNALVRLQEHVPDANDREPNMVVLMQAGARQREAEHQGRVEAERNGGD